MHAPLAPSVRHFGAVNWQGLWTLYLREVHRFLKVAMQTVFAPVISSLLFIVVFGLSLGGRIRMVEGFHYREFIVPGLVGMAMIQAAYSNNSASIFQARSDRYIHDVLSAPMRPWQMNLGVNMGGWARALAIGILLLAAAIPITGAPIHHPFFLLATVVFGVVLFGALGIVVGVYAETFDHHTFVNNIVILPLAFVGGVFADALETRFRRAFLWTAGGVLTAQAALCVASLYVSTRSRLP